MEFNEEMRRSTTVHPGLVIKLKVVRGKWSIETYDHSNSQRGWETILPDLEGKAVATEIQKKLSDIARRLQESFDELEVHKS